jgi:large subunit ribosomal protein L17
MRHRKSGVKLNRTTSHRQAMFRNMVTSLFKYDRITTTDAKAKELRRWADHIVTLAKRGDLHARRLAMSIVREKDVVHKIFEVAPERFGNVNGGYTRIIKVGRRPGDAAPMTVVELISSDSVKPKKAKSTQPVAAETKPAVVQTGAAEQDDQNDVAATEKQPADGADQAATSSSDDVQPTDESSDTDKQ